MPIKEPPTYITPLKSNKLTDVIITSEEEIDRQNYLIRHYSRNAYGEVRTIKEIRAKGAEEFLKLSEFELKEFIERATHFTGVFVIFLMTLLSTWIIFWPTSNQQQMDIASKLAFLIIGAILGRLFPTKGDDKK